MAHTPNRLEEFRQALQDPKYRCFGQPVSLEHNVYDESISAEDLELLDLIRRNLSALIDRVETEIRTYEESNPDALSHASEPCIYMEEPDVRDAPDDWTFVVCRDNHPSFQWLVEFRGIEFREIWAAS